MTFSKADIAIYAVVGLTCFTFLTAFVFALFNDTRTDHEAPSEINAHRRDDERR
jgi:hypothetical protein